MKPSPPERTLLVLTRFSPLGQTGTATYLFSILNYLHQHGVRVTICWSDSPGSAMQRGWWVVPQEFAAVATLLMPGAICLGRLRVFPSVFLHPLRRAPRRWLKRAILALGLGPLFGIGASTSQPEAPSTPVNPYQWDRPPDPYEYKFFGRALARLQPDAVIFNYCWMNRIADALDDPAQFLKITLTYDLRHLYSRLVDGVIRRSEGEWMSQALETDYLRRSDVIVAIRKDDAAVFRQLLPGKDVIASYPANTVLPSNSQPFADRCLFVAADNDANRDGLQWFLREAWPQIRAARPAAELHLCGTICRTLPPGDPPGVIRRGFVESLQAVYDEAAVVIVPLLHGSGVKIKLMEALAHGKACVSTPIGTEGVPALDECVCVAATAEAFAQGVMRLLGDDVARQTLETRALETIRERFSAEACYGPILQRIQQTAS